MSLNRSDCFWSAVISSKVRLTALGIEVMVVEGIKRDICAGFSVHTPRFYQKRWRQENRNYDMHDDN